MFNESIIKGCFAALGAFSQPIGDGYPALIPALTTSTTGRLINKVHPLLAVETLFAIAPQTTPEGFNNWLLQICEQSAIELVTLLMQNKKLEKLGKDVLESTKLYEGGGLMSSREIKLGRFVGYSIKVNPGQNISVSLQQIGLQTDGSLENMTIYLYRNTQDAPVATGIVNARGGLDFNWTKVTGFNLEDGGTYYLGYYETDLGTAQAISKSMVVSRPCSSCNRYNANAYRVWGRRFEIHAINVPSEKLKVTKDLFDESGIVVADDRNYGINLDLTVSCNVSNFFCKQSSLFSDAYVKLVGVNLMKEIAASLRINAIPEMARQTAAAELDPKKGSGSLVDDFNRSLAALDYDFTGFDNDCLPCNTRGKIIYGAI